MDGYAPLDSHTYMANPLPLNNVVTTEEYNNYLPTTLGIADPPIGYGMDSYTSYGTVPKPALLEADLSQQ